VLQLYNGDLKKVSKAIKIIQTADEKFLEQVMVAVERLWNKNELTMIEFAREVGVSKSQLSRKLKALTDLAPNDLVKECKLRRAVALMEDHQLNMAQVALEVGFSNPSYFTKCFRKRFGKAPSDYLVVLS
jgi:AraC-like DNA-binding protein